MAVGDLSSWSPNRPRLHSIRISPPALPWSRVCLFIQVSLGQGVLGRRSRKQARKKLLTGLEELAAVFVRTRFAVWTRRASATTACERLKQCLVPPCMNYSHLLCLSVRLTPPFSSAPAAASALEVSGRQLGRRRGAAVGFVHVS